MNYFTVELWEAIYASEILRITTVLSYCLHCAKR